MTTSSTTNTLSPGFTAKPRRRAIYRLPFGKDRANIQLSAHFIGKNYSSMAGPITVCMFMPFRYWSVGGRPFLWQGLEKLGTLQILITVTAGSQ